MLVEIHNGFCLNKLFVPYLYYTENISTLDYGNWCVSFFTCWCISISFVFSSWESWERLQRYLVTAVLQFEGFYRLQGFGFVLAPVIRHPVWHWRECPSLEPCTIVLSIADVKCSWGAVCFARTFYSFIPRAKVISIVFGFAVGSIFCDALSF